LISPPSSSNTDSPYPLNLDFDSDDSSSSSESDSGYDSDTELDADSASGGILVGGKWVKVSRSQPNASMSTAKSMGQTFKEMDKRLDGVDLQDEVIDEEDGALIDSVGIVEELHNNLNKPIRRVLTRAPLKLCRKRPDKVSDLRHDLLDDLTLRQKRRIPRGLLMPERFLQYQYGKISWNLVRERISKQELAFRKHRVYKRSFLARELWVDVVTTPAGKTMNILRQGLSLGKGVPGDDLERDSFSGLGKRKCPSCRGDCRWTGMGYRLVPKKRSIAA
jgi:hypothetical protein